MKDELDTDTLAVDLAIRVIFNRLVERMETISKLDEEERYCGLYYGLLEATGESLDLGVERCDGYRFYFSINDKRVGVSEGIDINDTPKMKQVLLDFCQKHLTQEVVAKYFGSYEDICKTNYNTYEIIMELINKDASGG